MNLIYKDECYSIIGACMEVHAQLGCGFLEPVYQEAAEVEFSAIGIPFRREHELKISYKNRILDKTYIADFICYDKIIVEFKAVDDLTTQHDAQVINYLKATNFTLGLLVNFGEERLTYKRLVW